MALLDDLRRQVIAESRLIGEMTDDFARELTRILGQTERRILRLMGTLDQADGRLVASRSSVARALRLRVELQAILEDSGYGRLVQSALTDPLDRLAAKVLDGRRLTGRVAKLFPIDVDTLSAWRMVREADLLGLGDDIVTSVWRSTVDGIVANRSVPSLVQEIAALTEASEARARTIYDTAASTYSRHVDQLGLDPDAGDRFVYVGPNDDATRPFCREHLTGEERTRAELDSIDNGQLPNTLLTGGGWNCRHKWLFVGERAQ